MLKFFFILLITIFHIQSNCFAEKIKIASGNKLGLYYVIANEICSLINSESNNIECEVIETDGAVENLTMLDKNKVDLAIVQEDALFDDDNEIKYHNVTGIIKLYPEVFTLVVPKSTNINFISDIAHKKLFAGKSTSGVRIFLKRLLDQLYLDDSDVVYQDNISAVNIPEMLCSGKIDAIAMMIAHPNPMVSEINKECKIKFVAVDDSMINTLSSRYPYYHKNHIEDNLYQDVFRPVLTMSTNAMLVTNNNVNYNIIVGMISKLIANIDKVRSSHIVLRKMDYNFMFDNFVIPKHKSVDKAIKILE